MNRIKDFNQFNMTDEQKEVINYFNDFGIDFNGFLVEIEENNDKEFIDGDYIVSIQQEEGFDQSFDVDPFLPESLKGKLEGYVSYIWTYDGDPTYLEQELNKSQFFHKTIYLK